MQLCMHIIITLSSVTISAFLTMLLCHMVYNSNKKIVLRKCVKNIDYITNFFLYYLKKSMFFYDTIASFKIKKMLDINFIQKYLT